MAAKKTITIEVAYALPDKQEIIKLEVPESTTIETAIDRSGILLLFHEIDLSKNKVGIFSKIKQLTDIVNQGDRIEIYRPLTIDPKELRRLRAKKMII